MSPDQLYPWLVGIPGVPQEFSDSMSPDQLYPWLLSNQLPENDCKLIKGSVIIIVVSVYVCSFIVMFR